MSSELSKMHDSSIRPESKGKAAKISLFVGSILMLLKFWAFKVTQSQAVLSDALESIINVLAAGVALFVIFYAAQPKDQDHPYGHGKSEYFSSAFEGGLISFAGFFIVVDAAVKLFEGRELRQLDLGLWIVAGAGIANLLLGLYLIYVGKRNHSLALRASGHHVISDFWTSAGILVALFVVKVTGYYWIDSAVAIIVGLYLSYTGVHLI
ncbi:MAG: cation transporter, partial [Bdellovibrionales bacterium]|nr:cation transporter [Bdellovibrionales bacterium]